jgi:dihydroorotate dehydrogenase
LVDEGDKVVTTSVSLTKNERAYLDEIVRKTGANRHEVLSVLLKLHGEGAMTLLKSEREKNEMFTEIKVLKNMYETSEDALTDVKLKNEELEKENKKLRAAVSSPSSLKDVSVKEKEREKEKTKSFFKRFGV